MPQADLPVNRIQSSELCVLSEDPLVGVLKLHTDDGEIELAINEGVALELLGLLDQFIDPDA